jgi:hypothetical protein
MCSLCVLLDDGPPGCEEDEAELLPTGLRDGDLRFFCFKPEQGRHELHTGRA